jgi:hypothetical protein
MPEALGLIPAPENKKDKKKKPLPKKTRAGNVVQWQCAYLALTRPRFPLTNKEKSMNHIFPSSLPPSTMNSAPKALTDAN